MKKIKLRPIRREHKKGTAIEIDLAIASTEIPDPTPAVLWVHYRQKRGVASGKFAGFVQLNDRFDIIKGAQRTFTPDKVGTYTVILVAKIGKRPVTYRGVPVHVTDHD